MNAKTKTKVTCSIEKITPKLAKAWLNENLGRQRNYNHKTVEEYAREMKGGYWMVNGEAIKFDEDGKLCDGQHRLGACIQSDTPFDSLVVRGIDRNAFETMDTGKKRHGGDVLTIMGVRNASSVAAAIRFSEIYRQCPIDKTLYENYERNTQINNHELKEIYLKDPTGWEGDTIMVASMDYRFAYELLAPAVAVFLYRMFHKIDPEKCAQFFTSMKSSVPVLTFPKNNQLCCPVIGARDKIMRMKMSDEKMNHRYWNHAKVAICLTAWNALVQGKGFVRFPSAEKNPWPEVANDPFRTKEPDSLTEV